jgi:hypothetical protein
MISKAIARKDLEHILYKEAPELHWQARAKIIAAIMSKLAIERRESLEEFTRVWKKHNVQHARRD